MNAAITTISDTAVALSEIDAVLADLNKERKAIELKISALSLAKTCLLTEIREVSSILINGQAHGNHKRTASNHPHIHQ